MTGGFAHLRSVHSWNADFVKNSAAGVQYQNLASEIDRALAFMVACGIDDDVFRTVDFYASHEALLPRVRARADPDRLPDAPAVRRVRSLPLDR